MTPKNVYMALYVMYVVIVYPFQKHQLLERRVPFFALKVPGANRGIGEPSGRCRRRGLGRDSLLFMEEQYPTSQGQGIYTGSI